MASTAARRFNFRVCSRTIFLTFPRCDFPLEAFVENVKNFFSGKDRQIVRGIASRENHQDGTPHLHLFVYLDKRFDSCRVDIFDQLVTPSKHPNVVTRLAGGQVKTMQYIAKDGMFLTFPPEFNYQAFLEEEATKTNRQKSKQSSITKLVSQAILEGALLPELDDEFPQYVMTHLQSLQRYLDYRNVRSLQTSRAADLLAPFRVRPADGHYNSWNIALVQFLNSSIRMNLPHRPTQMWLKAPPGAGKTSLINFLEDVMQLSIYRWPTDEIWFDGYQDGVFDLIVLDEYNAQKKITQLNPILSGDRVPLSRRGMAPYIKRDILPVIIMSNHTPREAYHKAREASLQALESRLQLVIAEGPIRLVTDVQFDDFLYAQTPVLDPPGSIAPPPEELFTTDGSTSSSTPEDNAQGRRLWVPESPAEILVSQESPEPAELRRERIVANARYEIKRNRSLMSSRVINDSSSDEDGCPARPVGRPSRWHNPHVGKTYPRITSFFEDEAEVSSESETFSSEESSCDYGDDSQSSFSDWLPSQDD